MLIKKVTVGYVIQTFDTDKSLFVAQEFVAGSDVTYENETGEIDDDELEKITNFGPYCEEEPYLPFEMVQPGQEEVYVIAQDEMAIVNEEPDNVTRIRYNLGCWLDRNEADKQVEELNDREFPASDEGECYVIGIKIK